jgi:two-component system, chemotaxis family, CheB/CheR fusion protein
VTADTPFSKMDLISCRNLLIYLALPLQMKVFHTFHFALKPSGLLLLGSVESLGRSSDLFGTVDPQFRMFYKKVTTSRISQVMFATAKLETAPIMTPPSQLFIPTASDMQRAADRIALGRFVPAGVLINESLDIIQFRGQTHPFLEPAQGEASLNLLTMVPFSVADALKVAIAEAKDQKLTVRRERVPLRRAELFREITFEVIPSSFCSRNLRITVHRHLQHMRRPRSPPLH